MEKRKNIKLNAVLNIVKNISAVLFSLIVFPYVSRVLLPENIGKVNFASTFVSYFSLIAGLGISTYAMRECSIIREDKEALGKKASEIYSINICTTVIAYVLMAITILCFRNLDSYRILIIIQSTTILFTTIGADWLNSAMEDFTYVTIRTVLFQILSLILIFIFVRSEGDYIKYAAITVVSTSGSNILNYFYRKRYCKVRFTFKMNVASQIKPIIFLFVMILSQNIFKSADITMLGIFKGDYEVGLYSTAVKIENIISLLFSSIMLVIMPRMSKLFQEQDYEKINQMFKKIFIFFITLGLPCVIGVIMVSREMIFLIAGEEYLGASNCLRILMGSLAFSLVGGSLLGNLILLPSKQEKKFMIICCIAAVFNVIANLIFIPLYGTNAAAITTACSSFLIFIMLFFVRDKNVHFPNLFKTFLSPVVGCLFIVGFCFLITYFVKNIYACLFISIFGSMLLYFLVLLVFKNEILMDGFAILKRFISRRKSYEQNKQS